MKKSFNITTRILCLVLCLTMLIPSVSAVSTSYTPSTSYRNGPYYKALQEVVLTGNQRADIVAIARSQVGYTEGNSKNALSGNGNGTKDYTEYGNWYGLQDMWCSMFVSWCAAQAGIPTSVVPKASWTVTGLNKFIEQNRAHSRSQVANGTYTPQAGDIIYFKSSRNNNKTNHVGIVTGYNSGTIYTIEGNTGSGGRVSEKSYSISNTYIVYICCPNYANSNKVTVSNERYFPACASHYTSIVSALKSISVDSSFSFRKQIAAANCISNYSGTASQNTKMLNLLKAGNLVRPGTTTSTVVSNVAFYPACASYHTSIVNALNSIGVNSSFEHRKTIAIKNGITNYTGSYDQNVQLLSLLKAGALKKSDSDTVSYFPACSSSHTSIVTALKSVGADSSYAYRKQIAAANNITNYSGTASQNTQMLNLLKSGKLIKP